MAGFQTTTDEGRGTTVATIGVVAHSGKTVGGGDEEVAGAYGGVADSKAQESLLGE